MTNGNLKDFLDLLYNGEELLFIYKNVKYFIQGWSEDGQSKMTLDIVNESQFQNYIWEYESANMKECADTFLSAPIWDGKIFGQIQDEVIWCDW